MGKVPGMSARTARFRPKLERKFAKKGIKGALNGLDREAVQRERDGNPMSETEYRARAIEIVTRGQALLDYRIDVVLGRNPEKLHDDTT